MKQFFSIAALACLLPAASMGQSADEGGVSFSLGLNQRLDASSDRDLSDPETGAGVDAVTTLTFGAITQTRRERLALDLGTGLRLSSGEDPQRSDSTATLSYSRTSADATLALSAGWAQADISYLRDAADFINVDGVIVLPDDLDELTGTGSRTTTTMGANLRWGDTAPLGYSLGLSHRVLRYGNASAALVDSATTTLTGGLRLDLDPVTTADLTLRYTRNDEAGSRPEDTTTLSGAITFDRPLGDLVARVSATRDDAGVTRWSTALRRQLDLPGAGLSGTLGLAQDDAGDAQVTGRLAYRYDLPDGRIDLSAGRSVAAGSDRRSTTFQASYAQALTPISNIRLGFDYAQARDLDSGRDIATGSLSASYGMQLTPDWQVNLGARANLRDDDGSRSRGTTVFVALDRALTWRP